MYVCPGDLGWTRYFGGGGGVEVRLRGEKSWVSFLGYDGEKVDL